LAAPLPAPGFPTPTHTLGLPLPLDPDGGGQPSEQWLVSIDAPVLWLFRCHVYPYSHAPSLHGAGARADDARPGPVLDAPGHGRRSRRGGAAAAAVACDEPRGDGRAGRPLRLAAAAAGHDDARTADAASRDGDSARPLASGTPAHPAPGTTRTCCPAPLTPPPHHRTHTASTRAPAHPRTRAPAHLQTGCYQVVGALRAQLRRLGSMPCA
jgi:hypothetical protein